MHVAVPDRFLPVDRRVLNGNYAREIAGKKDGEGHFYNGAAHLPRTGSLPSQLRLQTNHACFKLATDLGAPIAFKGDLAPRINEEAKRARRLKELEAIKAVNVKMC